ncbi:MAG: hypothetical protein HDR29_06095 [Lachnospiraceae bacterium]|nr:hypothetical protein [Lachnospiraceae bacterium]
MKKKLLFISVMSLMLTSCGKVTGNDSVNFPLPQTAEIFLIDRYVNYAWGYQDDGIFINTSGAVYAFDFGMTTLNHGTSDEQLLEKFDIIRGNTEPITTIDSDTIIELYSLGSQIDPESELNSKNVAMDAGSRTVSFCDPDTGKKTVCTKYGDDEGTLSDSFSKKFVNLYNIKIKAAIPEFTAPLVYTEYDIHLNNIECDTEMSGMYFLSSDEQLHILAKQCGMPIDNMLSDYTDYEQERYVYFVELNAAPANAVLHTDTGYKLSHAEGAGFCNVVAYPRSSGNFTSDSIPCADGGEWLRIKDGDLNLDPDFITGEAYGFSETAMREVWKAFDMHGFKGIYISDSAKYEEFIQSCDSHNLVENGSIRSTLEENGAPDFSKYSLCVKLDSHNDNSKYEWQRTEIGDRYITMGSSISLNWDNTVGECTLAYVLIPKTYLSEDCYSVGCLNKGWNEK